MTVHLKATVILTLECDPSEDDAYKQEWSPFEAERDICAALQRYGPLTFDEVEVDAEYVEEAAL